MVDRSAIESALLLADRGYESYNNLGCQWQGFNFYLLYNLDGNLLLLNTLDGLLQFGKLIFASLSLE